LSRAFNDSVLAIQYRFIAPRANQDGSDSGRNFPRSFPAESVRFCS
jgi:hypothetical protein